MKLEQIREEIEKINDLRKDFNVTFTSKDYDKASEIHNNFFTTAQTFIKELDKLESIELVNTKIYKNEDGEVFTIYEEKTLIRLCLYNKLKTQENIYIPKNLIIEKTKEDEIEIDENRALLFFYYSNLQSKLFNIPQTQFLEYQDFLNNNEVKKEREVNVFITENLKEAKEFIKKAKEKNKNTITKIVELPNKPKKEKKEKEVK